MHHENGTNIKMVCSHGHLLDR
jgi:hypothetical protein